MTDDTEPTRGFRPSARRRNRIAAGVALGAAAIGGNALIYASVDDTETVVQALRDIPAGAEITPDMFRTVEVDIDDTVLAVPGEQLAGLSGQYAKVRIVSGSLLVTPAIQPDPLVDDDAAVVAIEVPGGLVPVGLRERSRIEVVYTDTDDQDVVVRGRTIGFPEPSESSAGSISLSIEVAGSDAPGIAIADDVRVVLLSPAEQES